MQSAPLESAGRCTDEERFVACVALMLVCPATARATGGLSVQADDFAKLAHALNLDKRGFFHKEAPQSSVTKPFYRTVLVSQMAGVSTIVAEHGRIQVLWSPQALCCAMNAAIATIARSLTFEERAVI